MKKQIKLMTLSLITGQMAFGFNINQVRGEHKNLLSPSGQTETCVIPQKLIPEVYSQKDLENENELCEMDFYQTQALCPKQNSTNPGVLVAKIGKGISREQTMTQLCKGPSDDLKVEAKFKNSISCSYTPSILAYYHFSKILKAGRVPVAVLRTMDKFEHLKIAEQGKIMTKSTSTINTTWNSFINEHKNLTNTNIFDDTKSYVYGALSENPKKELRYKEIYGERKGVFTYDRRYELFATQKPYQNVANNKTILEIAGSNDLNKIIPLVVQMKDVSDMMLMDSLLTQHDRMGNIHYKMAWYFVETDTKTGNKKISNKNSDADFDVSLNKWAIPDDEKLKFESKGAILVKEMILKDNDCGVDVNKRTNYMSLFTIKPANANEELLAKSNEEYKKTVDTLNSLSKKLNGQTLLSTLRHMSPRTYTNFMKFYEIAKKSDTIGWMKNDLRFTDADLGLSTNKKATSFLSNLERVRSILLENCKNGSLKLDLDLESYLPGAEQKQTACE